MRIVVAGGQNPMRPFSLKKKGLQDGTNSHLGCFRSGGDKNQIIRIDSLPQRSRHLRTSLTKLTLRLPSFCMSTRGIWNQRGGTDRIGQSLRARFIIEDGMTLSTRTQERKNCGT